MNKTTSIVANKDKTRRKEPVITIDKIVARAFALIEGKGIEDAIAPLYAFKGCVDLGDRYQIIPRPGNNNYAWDWQTQVNEKVAKYCLVKGAPKG